MPHTFSTSRLPRYKTPFGAIAAGTPVTLRLDVPGSFGYVDPHLVLTKDREDPVHYRMEYTGQSDGVTILRSRSRPPPPGSTLLF